MSTHKKSERRCAWLLFWSLSILFEAMTSECVPFHSWQRSEEFEGEKYTNTDETNCHNFINIA